MENLLKQWWDKRIWLILGGLAVLHVIAALIQHHQAPSLIVLALVGLATVVLTYRSLPLGLAVAFLEIFVGGHGHLIDAEVFGLSLSIRMVLFAAVMAGWGLLVITGKAKPTFNHTRDLPLILLGVAVILGSVKGFLTNNPGDAFDDMNGYLTLLYLLPIISVQWGNSERRLLLLTLMTGGIWVAVTTLALFFAFTHLPGKMLFELYTFVRDARLAEITLLNGDTFSRFLGDTPWYFRVFLQSQATILALLLLLAANCYSAITMSRREMFFMAGVMALLVAGFAAGQSRSLVLGALAGIVALNAVVLVGMRLIKPFLRTKAIGIAAILAAGASLFILAILPLPPRPDLSEAAFYKKDAGDSRDLAVSSRWKLLPPMMDEIIASPALGSGFGETVTFISDDPRLRAIEPSGEVTTYRFEWGFQDIWLKMGILGLMAFIWYYLTIAANTIDTLRVNRHAWAAVGWFSVITALYAANIFTPYLNHPIGLGLLLIALPFYSWGVQPSKERVENHHPIPANNPKTLEVAYRQKNNPSIL